MSMAGMKRWILIGIGVGVLWYFWSDVGKERGPGTGAVVEVAESLVGAPYRAGGESSEGFDCSGLTSFVFKQAGHPIPRDSRSQWVAGGKVEPGEELPGDLIFFKGSNLDSDRIGHVGIIISGSGEDIVVIHASKRGVVKERIFDLRWYEVRFVGIRRM